MTKKTRRRYTAEFKTAAVARLDEPGETFSSVARALGVAATQVKTWRLEQQAAGSAEAVARRRSEATELQQLHRDNKPLFASGRTVSLPDELAVARLAPGHVLEAFH